MTVPAPWDVREGRVVNNESGDLLRMLGARAADGPDLYPEAHRAEIEAIKRHSYVTHRGINPTGIVPAGPALDLLAPHGRAALAAGPG